MSHIDDLVSQMTLDEKISMLAGTGLWYSTAVPRLGIPSFRMADGPNGVRGIWSEMSPTAAATPVGTALGATWNPQLVEKIGNVLGEELKDKSGHILLGPTVNIHRTPIAGRNFECFAEDPYLSGMIASAYIKGIQDKGVGACIKHFVANDQEYERTTISSEVDERTLREIYLEPFRIAIRNSNPWAVMSSYNRVNGRYACEYDHTLLEILKGEWGYQGIVMSDWFGTYDEEAPTGGLDIEMPGPARWMANDIAKKALGNGTVTEQRIDEKVRRLLNVLEKAGLFENPVHHPEIANNNPKHRKIMRDAAGEAIVLLKNDGGILPLKKIKSIAVIGPHAAHASIFGGGSSSGFRPHHAVSPLEGVKARAGKNVRVNYAPGCLIHKTIPAPAPETLSTADGRPGLSLSLFNGIEFSGDPVFTQTTPFVEHGWFHFSVPNANQESFSMIQEGFFTPQESGVHKFALGGVGWSKLFLDDKLLIDHSHDSDMGRELTAEIELEGDKPYPIRIEYYWQGDPRWRSVKLGHQPPQSQDPIGDAVKLAKKADVVILVASLNNEWEAEGFDRVDMKLPGQQNELIRKVAKANKNTIVVLNVGSAVEMPWINKVPAVLQLWYDSQEQGHALADVLFGDVNPSGKLPTTFPLRLEDNPAFINYPGENGKVRYGEGIFVGYRYYDKKDIAPLFPFGHGLSYTKFKYRNLRLSAKSLKPADKLKVKVDVTNTGKVPGKEIVQLYVRDVKSTFARPEKELKAFAKVELKSEQTKTVTFTLDREAFWYFDTARNGWKTEPGEFEILVGASSRDIREKRTVILEPEPRTSRLHIGLPIKTLLADKDALAVLSKFTSGPLMMGDISQVEDMSLEQVAAAYPEALPETRLAQIENELAKIR
ncbi:MAG TPA: glycoside hydrolase family 3 C-terminal domain-containing protein [Anaerolineales bacterium]|nr:glycoside hydrolase family 3 C-terminal domain-containing protein [Anaerolineales bacterium]